MEYDKLAKKTAKEFASFYMTIAYIDLKDDVLLLRLKEASALLEFLQKLLDTDKVNEKLKSEIKYKINQMLRSVEPKTYCLTTRII